MNILLGKIPDYLVNRHNVLRQILFTALFALLFINIYTPFNAEKWVEAGKAALFFYSCLYILAGMMVILGSRLGFYTLSLKTRMNYLFYLIWIFFEINLLAFAYTILDQLILHSGVNPYEQYFRLLLVTVFVLAIPYSISWLYFAWKDQKRILAEMTDATSEDYATRKMINFYDETDKLRFSLSSQDVLYIESTDNYVTVFVTDENRIKKIMLRNTMKRLEKELENTLIRRCHRSYMVNFENVKMLRLSGTSLFIYLNTPEENRIPVSRTYTEAVHAMINRIAI